jgi:hypothetical protein
VYDFQARLELTRVEQLSDVASLGYALVLTSSIIQGRKGLQRTNILAYFASSIARKKALDHLTPGDLAKGSFALWRLSL